MLAQREVGVPRGGLRQLNWINSLPERETIYLPTLSLCFQTRVSHRQCADKPCEGALLGAITEAVVARECNSPDSCLVALKSP